MGRRRDTLRVTCVHAIVAEDLVTQAPVLLFSASDTSELVFFTNDARVGVGRFPNKLAY